MKELKIYFYTRFSLIIAGGSYLLSQFVAFMIEYHVSNASIWSVLFLRGSTLLLDMLVILPGVLAILMTIFRKKITKSNIITVVMVWFRKSGRKSLISKKSTLLTLYIADTFGLFMVFYLPYIIRLFVLYELGNIQKTTFVINMIIGVASLLFLGFWGKRIIKNLNRFGRKRLKKVQ